MAEAISTAGEEAVGELRRQLPGRDPEQAGLPAAPSGHHQLRMLEAARPLLDSMRQPYLLTHLFMALLDGG